MLLAFMRTSMTRGIGGIAVRPLYLPCGFLRRIARS